MIVNLNEEGKQTMTNSERFAVNQWLVTYPEDITYEEIIEELYNENLRDEIDVWEVVEDFPTEDVAEFIEDTKTAYERSVAEKWVIVEDFGEQNDSK